MEVQIAICAIWNKVGGILVSSNRLTDSNAVALPYTLLFKIFKD